VRPSPESSDQAVTDDTFTRLRYLRSEVEDTADRYEEGEVAPAAPADSGADEAKLHEFVHDAEPEQIAQYLRIRETDDVDAVAVNSGYPAEVVQVAKENLFCVAMMWL
jgi:hypothetical protein